MATFEIDENGNCKTCGKKHSYPHKNGCQFCEETRPHHHIWGCFGQKTELEECSPKKLGTGETMTFSDDDLKRLKDDCEKDFTGIYPHQQKAILALIARLEAAEVVMETIVKLTGSESLLSYQAWRKAAGK